MTEQQFLLMPVKTSIDGGIERNKNGSINHRELKAIAWYADHFGYKLMAGNALPVIYFKDNAGKEISVKFSDIKLAYNAFNQRSSRNGKKVAS